MYGEAPWCASFVQEDLEVYEYAEDLQYHWTDGYGDSLNYEQTCDLLKDIVLYLRWGIQNIYAKNNLNLVCLFSYLPDLSIFQSYKDLHRLTPMTWQPEVKCLTS